MLGTSSGAIQNQTILTGYIGGVLKGREGGGAKRYGGSGGQTGPKAERLSKQKMAG